MIWGLWQALPMTDVTKLDIYVGVVLTLFTVDRAVYIVKNATKKEEPKNGSNGNGNGKSLLSSVVPTGYWDMDRRVREVHEWLGKEDPDTGLQMWRVAPKELRVLQATLDRLAKGIERNNNATEALLEHLKKSVTR